MCASGPTNTHELTGTTGRAATGTTDSSNSVHGLDNNEKVVSGYP